LLRRKPVTLGPQPLGFDDAVFAVPRISLVASVQQSELLDFLNNAKYGAEDAMRELHDVGVGNRGAIP
jgi:hypothetical protein